MTAANDREVTKPTAPDLHTALEAAITARLKVARAATPGPWSRYGNLGYAVFTEAYDDPDYDPPAVTHGSDTSADAEFIVRHDPADAVRRYERDLKVLKRHAPSERPTGTSCDYCESLCHSRSGLGCESPDAPWPCDDYRDVLDVYPEVTR